MVATRINSKARRQLKFVSAILAFSFAILIFFGVIEGSLFEESDAILDMIWGQIMLIDLYLGFFVFMVLVQFIERSWKKSVAWFVPTLFLGNFVPLIYIAFFLFKSGED